MLKAPAKASMEKSDATSGGILIVDDEPGKLAALEAVLEPLGEQIVKAESGAVALRHLLKREFAVILLDVRMPAMDGFETARLIRSRRQSELTPIIFVTALERAETDMNRGYELGAVDFVFAPVSSAALRAKATVFVELYRAQQELKRYRAQLEELVADRTRALMAVNRELKTFSQAVVENVAAPLTTIEGQVAVITKSSPMAADTIETARLRIQNVLLGLQTLVRIASHDVHSQDVNLSELAQEVAADLLAPGVYKGVRFEIEEGMRCVGDPALLRVMLHNLMDNACKFSQGRADAVVTVGSTKADGDTNYFVKDRGVGFDMISAHRLFAPFQRLHSREEFSGEGLGLAVAQRIIQAHGGRIWAASSLDQGATFTFTL